MSKDPAVLFYTADFLTGTMLMSDDQVGKYIRLLCVQHQCGRIPESKMIEFTKGDPIIMSKFERDDNGLYFNTRMEEESSKRKNFVESRKNGAYAMHMQKHKRLHTGKHVDMLTENENDNDNSSSEEGCKGGTSSSQKRFQKPTLEEVSDYCIERKNNVDAQKWMDYYESNGWRVGKNPMKDWRAAVRTWERNSYGSQPQKPAESIPLYHQPLPY